MSVCGTDLGPLLGPGRQESAEVQEGALHPAHSRYKLYLKLRNIYILNVFRRIFGGKL